MLFSFFFLYIFYYHYKTHLKTYLFRVRDNNIPGQKGKLVELPRSVSVRGPGALFNDVEFLADTPAFSKNAYRKHDKITM